MSTETKKRKELIMNSVETNYINEINSIPKLTEEEEKELFISLANGKDVKNKLIEHNLYIVPIVARKFMGSGLELSDLIQEGTFGLITAIEKYDVTKGFKFCTYAPYWIKLAIQRAINSSVRTIRIPVYIMDKVKEIARFSNIFVNTNGREPTSEEIGSALDISTDKVEEYLRYYLFPSISYDEMFVEKKKGDKSSSLNDIIKDDSVNVEDTAIHNIAIEQVKSLLIRLNENERKVIELRYGFVDNEERTLSEVGKILGISKQGCAWLEAEAMKKLRKAMSVKIST